MKDLPQSVDMMFAVVLLELVVAGETWSLKKEHVIISNISSDFFFHYLCVTSLSWHKV